MRFLALFICCCVGCNATVFKPELNTAEEAEISAHNSSGLAYAIVSHPVSPDVNPDVPVVPKPADGQCPDCHGTGRTGDGLSACPACGGTGRIRTSADVPQAPQPVSKKPEQVKPQQKIIRQKTWTPSRRVYVYPRTSRRASPSGHNC